MVLSHSFHAGKFSILDVASGSDLALPLHLDPGTSGGAALPPKLLSSQERLSLSLHSLPLNLQCPNEEILTFWWFSLS